MSDQTNDSRPKFELEAEALMALEKARAMPRGMERAEALKKGGGATEHGPRNVCRSTKAAGLQRPKLVSRMPIGLAD
ncbi:MAG TPA: hypothetical protein VLT36_01105, partial [Candidatus Dormibacteraeota bacterium]|nr:hypothetical protein [Candidatus Dormibacteraeota bacterium]